MREKKDKPVVKIVREREKRELGKKRIEANGVESLREVDSDEPNVRLICEVFGGLMQNGRDGCGSGSGWSESMLVRKGKMNRLRGVGDEWVEIMSDYKALKNPGRQTGMRDRPIVRKLKRVGDLRGR